MTAEIASKGKETKEAIGQDYNVQLNNSKTKQTFHYSSSGQGQSIINVFSIYSSNSPVDIHQETGVVPTRTVSPAAECKYFYLFFLNRSNNFTFIRKKSKIAKT